MVYKPYFFVLALSGLFSPSYVWSALNNSQNNTYQQPLVAQQYQYNQLQSQSSYNPQSVAYSIFLSSNKDLCDEMNNLKNELDTMIERSNTSESKVFEIKQQQYPNIYDAHNNNDLKVTILLNEMAERACEKNIYVRLSASHRYVTLITRHFSSVFGLVSSIALMMVLTNEHNVERLKNVVSNNCNRETVSYLLDYVRRRKVETAFSVLVPCVYFFKDNLPYLSRFVPQDYWTYTAVMAGLFYGARFLKSGVKVAHNWWTDNKKTLSYDLTQMYEGARAKVCGQKNNT